MKSICVILITLLVFSCKKKESETLSPSSNSDVVQVFSESWNLSELSAIAFDPASNNLFYVKSTAIATPNEIHRFNFGTNKISTVFSYGSQYDYGMRVLNGDLFVARSYDKSILRLTDLASDNLTKVGVYPDSSGTTISLTEIEDITMVDGNIYFVCGNFLNGPQNNGIQCLQSPDFISVNELLSSINAKWPEVDNQKHRSLISVENDSSINFVVSTGTYIGKIELRDHSGSLIKSVDGFGESFLQKDSKGRIYTITGTGNNTKITRWSANLDNKEEFQINFSQNNSGNGLRFIIKETGTNIEVIMVQYRTSNPIFYKTTIPK